MITKRDCSFPSVNNSINDVDKYSKGLTKREYFAAMALQGICTTKSDFSAHMNIAKDAVEFAEALIEALNKEEE